MEVRIETFGDIEMARVRHVGRYNEIGPCFERLFKWAATIGARPRAAAAGQPSGVLMASPRTVSGRASAERGRGRSQRA